MSLVKLRPITIEDTANILRWRNSNDVQKNFIYQQDITREEHLDWLKNKVATGEVAQFIITDISSGQEIGSVYLRDIDYDSKRAEFGIFIGENEARGRGLGEAATAQILEYGFETLQLKKIFLRVFADNLPAIKCYQKTGFSINNKKEMRIIDGHQQEIIFMEKHANA